MRFLLLVPAWIAGFTSAWMLVMAAIQISEHDGLFIPAHPHDEVSGFGFTAFVVTFAASALFIAVREFVRVIKLELGL